MPLPSTKEELLKNLTQVYEKLDGEFEGISSERERIREIEGNVSCCDVIAYQIGWGKLLLGWEENEKNGKTPEMPASGFKWNQLGDLANTFYERKSKKSLDQLRKELKAVVQEIIGWIDSLEEQDLFQRHQRKWAGEKWPIVKWIQVNTIAPYRSARTKVRRWKKENEI